MVRSESAKVRSALTALGHIVPNVLLVAALAVVLLKIGFGDVFRPRNVDVAPHLNSTISSVAADRVQDFMRGTKGEFGLIVVTDPADFGCPPCFEDFQRLSEQIRPLVAGEEARRGFYLLRQGSSGPWHDPRAVQQWARAQDLPFRVVMVPETTYAQLKLPKTTAIVVDQSLRTVFMEQLPLTHNGHAQIYFLMEKQAHADHP